MAFSWVLRRRAHPTGKAAAEPTEAAPAADVQSVSDTDVKEEVTASLIDLRVEDGLLMTFGPLGDPVPPAVVKTVCASEADGMLKLPSGELVDHRRVIEVLEMQQRRPLADHPNDRWIEAMLGVGGGFETTPDEVLASEIVDTGPVSRDQLRIGTISDRTLRLRDAHPGDVHDAPPLQIKRDGEATSVRAVCAEATTKNAGDGTDQSFAAATIDGSIRLRGETIAVDLPGRRAVVLEKAFIVWDGQPKVDLAWADGGSTTLDDVLARLQAEARETKATDLTSSAPVTCPLLPANQSMSGLDQATIVMISGLPDDWSLTKGKKNNQGAWLLNPVDIDAADVVMRGKPARSVSLALKAIAVTGPDGSLEGQTLQITCPPPTIDAAGQTTPTHGQQSAVADLTFDETELAAAAKADALLVRGLSEEMSLSAGTYDPVIRGWVLLPREVGNLSITSVGEAPGPVEIDVMAIQIGGDGNQRKKLIAIRAIAFG